MQYITGRGFLTDEETQQLQIMNKCYFMRTKTENIEYTRPEIEHVS